MVLWTNFVRLSKQNTLEFFPRNQDLGGPFAACPSVCQPHCVDIEPLDLERTARITMPVSSCMSCENQGRQTNTDSLLQVRLQHELSTSLSFLPHPGPAGVRLLQSPQERAENCVSGINVVCFL